MIGGMDRESWQKRMASDVQLDTDRDAKAAVVEPDVEIDTRGHGRA